MCWFPPPPFSFSIVLSYCFSLLVVCSVHFLLLVAGIMHQHLPVVGEPPSPCPSVSSQGGPLASYWRSSCYSDSHSPGTVCLVVAVTHLVQSLTWYSVSGSGCVWGVYVCEECMYVCYDVYLQYTGLSLVSCDWLCFLSWECALSFKQVLTYLLSHHVVIGLYNSKLEWKGL